MGVIGTLQLNIVAHTDGLRKGFSKAKKDAKTFTGSMKSTLGSVTKLASGLTGIAGIGGLAGLGIGLKNAAEDLDNLGKTADKLGVTTEALTRLRFAGEQTGVATEKMDLAIQRMLKSVSDAGNGLSTPLRAFQALNISLEDLQGLKPDQQFIKLAGALNKVEDPAIKVGAAMDLFGRAGADVIVTAQQGASGLAELAKQADELGLSVSRQNIKKVEEFNDSLNRMKKAFGGAFRNLIIDIAPIAMSAVDKLTNVAQQLTGKKEGLIADAIEGTSILHQMVKDPLHIQDNDPFNDLIRVPGANARFVEDQLQVLERIEENTNPRTLQGPRALAPVTIIPQ